jgi:hypothetical protein
VLTRGGYLLSCVQKIQSLEINMADGTQDGEALQEELAKLVHARNSLPHNYGFMPLLLKVACECGALADSKHHTLKHHTGQRVVLAGLSVVLADFWSDAYLMQGFVARQQGVSKIIFSLLHRPCLAQARHQLRQMIRWNSTGIRAGM